MLGRWSRLRAALGRHFMRACTFALFGTVSAIPSSAAPSHVTSVGASIPDRVKALRARLAMEDAGSGSSLPLAHLAQFFNFAGPGRPFPAPPPAIQGTVPPPPVGRPVPVPGPVQSPPVGGPVPVPGPVQSPP